MFETVEMNVTLYPPPLIFPYRYFFLLLPFNPPFARASQEVSPTSSEKRERGGATGRERGRGRRVENATKSGSVSRTTRVNAQ